MKKFSFSMQSFADVCAAREQAAEQKLMAVLKEQAETKTVLQLLIDRRQELVSEIESLRGVLARRDWSSKVRYLQGFEGRILQQRRTLHELVQREEACREALQEEMKMRRVLEKLEKNERAQWREAVRVEEQKQMDEVAASRWFRQEEHV